MKYFVSDKTLKAIKGGWPMCDVYMPREATETRKRAIDIAILAHCDACDAEFVLEEKNDHESGYFCNHCLGIDGD